MCSASGVNDGCLAPQMFGLSDSRLQGLRDLEMIDLHALLVFLAVFSVVTPVT